MITKKKPLHALRTTLSEMRSNAGTPGTPATLDLIVSHQSPFPWLNTVTFVSATPEVAEDEGR